MYRVRLLGPATKELGQLEKPIGNRVLRRLNWLAANLDSIRPEALSGEFAGLYKLRVGDFRVVYDVLHDERVIVVHSVAHRSIVYRRG